MAASDSRPIPRKNVAFRVTFPIFDADGDLVTGATGLDSEVSIDGGAFSDCTNEATEIATSSGIYYLDLSSGEMNGDTVTIIVKTSTSGAKTTPIIIYPEELGDLRVDVGQISGDATAADNAEAFFDGTGYAGTNNVIPTVTTAGLADGAITAAKIASDAITAAKVAADVTTEIQSGLATAASIAALNNLSAAAVNAEVDSALADYDAPTKAELDSAVAALATAAALATVDSVVDAILLDTGTDGVVVASASKSGYSLAADQSAVTVGTVNALGTQAKADVNAEADTALSDVGVTTTVTGRIDAAVSTRATPAQVATELGTYDAPTKAELDTAVASLATASALTTVGSNVASILADTGTDGVVLSTAQMQALADIVLGRSVSGIDNTASTHSLYELIQAILESSTATGSWVIKKTDGSTTFNTRTVVTDAGALPIVGVS